MRKQKYYQKETVKEFILRFLARFLTIAAITMTIITIAVMVKLERDIQELEKRLNVNENHYYLYEERISVKESMMEDIMALPLPKEEVLELKNSKKEDIQTENLQDEKCQESIQDYDSDVELLAKLMYAEEGILIYKLPEDEAKKAHMLAGSVVLNRVKMHYKGANTIKDVIYQEGQYECVSNESINQKVPDIVYKWAQELICNGSIGPENMIYQAEFEQGIGTYEYIYNQYFCLK